MNKRIVLAGVYILCFLVTLPLLSQTQISPNNKEAIYQIGETVNFQAKASTGGTYTYKIYYDTRTEAIENGTITLSANQTRSIPFRANKAGVILCSITGPGGADVAAVTIAPFDIAPLENEPSDFDQYWNTQKNLVRSLGTTPQLAIHRNNANSTTYTLSLPNLNGRKVYGYLTVPKGSGPFPAAIIFPAFGASAASTSEEALVAETGGLLTVSLSVHNTPVTQQDPNAYQPDNPSNRDEIYYRYALAGALNVINYLQTRPDFDQKNICTMGVSQGGGLAMLLAGIDNRVNLLVNSNPAMNEHQGHKYQQASGFPYYLNDALRTRNGQSAYDATSSATKYYDAIYANRRFKGSSYTLVGLKDDVVPSATSLAGYNQLSGEKILLISTKGGHGHPGEYWNGRFDFLRRHYQLNPPAQFVATTKGYHINAGTDKQATANSAISLAATVQLDNQNLSNLPGQWLKVSGPGSVNFSNSRSVSTNVTFTQAGTYVVRYQAQDNRKLDSEGKILFLSDDITITVGTGSTDNGGSTGGTTTEPPTPSSISINCPSNITVTAAPGQNTATASWSAPSVNSTCSTTNSCTTNISGFRYLGQVGSSNYFLANNAFTWKEAEVDARRQGGNMASVDNQEVNDLIQQMGEIIYIGLTDEEREGTFKWVDGTPLQYINFQEDVNNSNGLDYIALNPWDGSWAYYDNSVSKKYILEIPCTGNTTAGSTPNQVSGPSSGSNFSIGTTTISYSATDPCGNRTTCSFTVTVNSSPATLSLSCPANQTVELEAGQRQRSINWQSPSVSSNCASGATTNQLGGPSINSSLQAGNYTVSYEAIDNCNNRKTCSFLISILEAPTTITPPTSSNSTLDLTCPDNRIIELASTENGAVLSWNEPTVTSTCTNGTGADCTALSFDDFSFIGQSNGSNYYLSNGKATWENASKKVALLEGHLVKIESATENDYLKGLLSPNYYLVGLSDAANEGTFIWSDGSQPSYKNFETNLGNSTFNNYIMFNAWTGSWQLTGGDVHLRYIMEVPCSSGSGVTVEKTAGPDLGAFANIGTHFITYTANDACGNTTSCNFSISISKTATPGNSINCEESREIGTIGVSENVCGSFQATIISELFTPVGVNNDYEHIWLQSTTTCPNSITQQIVGADKEMYDPGFISTTTYFTRWSRLKGCTTWMKGNCVVKEVQTCEEEGNTDNSGSTSTSSCIIKPQSITLFNGKTIGGEVQSLINGNGLSEESLSAKHNTGNLYDGIWLNDGYKSILKLDIGSVQRVDGIVIWNYAYHTWQVLKRRGVKDFTISTSTDDTNFEEEINFSAAITTASGMSENAQIFSFPARNARYLKIKILNAQDDASYVGLGEIRVINNCGRNSTSSEEFDARVITNFDKSATKPNKELANWNIFPNPSNGILLFSNSYAKKHTTITIFNELGKQVYFQGNIENNSRLNLQELPKGLYFVKLQGSLEEYQMKKIIIQ